jgi:hypothetical protein
VIRGNIYLMKYKWSIRFNKGYWYK